MCIIELSDEQKNSVEAYVRSNTENIDSINLPVRGFTFQLNTLLRANLDLGNQMNQFINSLDSAFANSSIQENITVYRVCNYLEMIRYIQGTNFVDFGYMSTARGIGTTHRFYQQPAYGYYPAFITINIPANSNVLDLDRIAGFDNTTYESEILIKRKSLFEITTNQIVATETLLETIGMEAQCDFQEIRVLEMNFIRYI